MSCVIDHFDIVESIELIVLRCLLHTQVEHLIDDDNVGVHLFDPELIGCKDAVMPVCQ